MNNDYPNQGYDLEKQFYEDVELLAVRQAVLAFQARWRREHESFYDSKAVNSAYVTRKNELPDELRLVLFKLIASHKLFTKLTAIFKSEFRFMNTQVFFNPANSDQKNYWHRDPQYHLSLKEQKQALQGPQVVHVRIPLFNEPGIELIPETHVRWDTQKELDVRMERGMHKNHEPLDSGVAIALDVGDVLIFSANMIHRGLYGQDRLALDIVFCEPSPQLLSFIDVECLPEAWMTEQLDHAEVFKLGDAYIL